MKTKEELMGDLLFYPVVTLLSIVGLIYLVPQLLLIVVGLILAVLVIIIYGLCYAIMGGIVFGFEYLFIVQKEHIEGTVISIKEKNELLTLSAYDSNSDNPNYLIPGPTIMVTNYFLKVKKGMKWYTVKVPLYVFQKVKNQIKAGVKTIDLQCEKYSWEKFYEPSKSII